MTALAWIAAILAVWLAANLIGRALTRAFLLRARLRKASRPPLSRPGEGQG